MKKNIGKTDAVIRIIIAVVLLYFVDGVTGTFQIVLGVIAGALILTALSGVCLLYTLLGYSSRMKRGA